MRWRYWEIDEETGEYLLDAKGKKIPYCIWCECQVAEVADGVTTKRTPRCSNLMPAGALRVRWPADAKREEPEKFAWIILNPADFSREVISGWRWAERELTTPPRAK